MLRFSAHYDHEGLGRLLSVCLFGIFDGKGNHCPCPLRSGFCRAYKGGMALEEGTIKKQIILSGILVAVISGILMFIGCVVYGSIKGAQEKEAQKYMREVVSQYRSIITAQIDGDLQTLDALAAFVGRQWTLTLYSRGWKWKAAAMTLYAWGLYPRIGRGI